MVLVSTLFSDGVDNIQKTEDKLRELNINMDRLYYMPKNPPVTKLPEIFRKKGG